MRVSTTSDDSRLASLANHLVGPIAVLDFPRSRRLPSRQRYVHTFDLHNDRTLTPRERFVGVDAFCTVYAALCQSPDTSDLMYEHQAGEVAGRAAEAIAAEKGRAAREMAEAGVF